MTETLGERLKREREQQGWTLRDLEIETGVSNGLISQIETGHVRNPSFKNVVALANALVIPLDFLSGLK